jgi:hypothetical protein
VVVTGAGREALTPFVELGVPTEGGKRLYTTPSFKAAVAGFGRAG